MNQTTSSGLLSRSLMALVVVALLLFGGTAGIMAGETGGNLISIFGDVVEMPTTANGIIYHYVNTSLDPGDDVIGHTLYPRDPITTPEKGMEFVSTTNGRTYAIKSVAAPEGGIVIVECVHAYNVVDLTGSAVKMGDPPVGPKANSVVTDKRGGTYYILSVGAFVGKEKPTVRVMPVTIKCVDENGRTFQPAPPLTRFSIGTTAKDAKGRELVLVSVGEPDGNAVVTLGFGPAYDVVADDGKALTLITPLDHPQKGDLIGCRDSKTGRRYGYIITEVVAADAYGKDGKVKVTPATYSYTDITYTDLDVVGRGVTPNTMPTYPQVGDFFTDSHGGGNYIITRIGPVNTYHNTVDVWCIPSISRMAEPGEKEGDFFTADDGRDYVVLFSGLIAPLGDMTDAMLVTYVVKTESGKIIVPENDLNLPQVGKTVCDKDGNGGVITEIGAVDPETGVVVVTVREAIPGITGDYLMIMEMDFPNGMVGEPYKGNMGIIGQRPISLEVIDGALPDGLHLVKSMDEYENMLVVEGTPTKAGIYTFTIKATDPRPRTDSKTITITIDPAPPITGDYLQIMETDFPNGMVGEPYKGNMGIIGQRPISFEVIDGALPDGLHLVKSMTDYDDPLVVEGTPTKAGTYTFTIKATDPRPRTDTETITITIDPAPPIDGDYLAIMDTNFPVGMVGEPYAGQMHIIGQRPISFEVIDGALPDGLHLVKSMTNYDDPLVVEGTPTKAGTYTFTIKATDPRPRTDSVTLTVTIGDPQKLAALKDVSTKNWFYNSVKYSVIKGLMTGMTEDSFAPTATTNRAMVVTTLYRMDKEPQVSGDIIFNDVKTAQWYSNAILWAYQNGIVTGFEANRFGPLNDVTREQMAVFLYRYLVYKGYVFAEKETDLSAYTDAATISSWAKTSMMWAIDSGLMVGRDANTLAPKAKLTRAETAELLMRFCETILK